jgi:predicted permease
MNTALKGETGGVPRYRLFGMFVASQTSISLVLLIVAALLLRSLFTSSTFDIGFDSKNILVATVDTQRHSFTDQQGREFFAQLTERVKALPMVRSVTYATVTPLGSGRESQGFEIPGQQNTTGKTTFSIDTNSVGPDYFHTMAIPLLKGRDFTKQEIEGKAPPAVIINETMAKQFWANQNPVGKKIRLPEGPNLEIVGVAKNIQYYSIGEEPQPYIYTTPAVIFIGQMTMHIRTAGDPDNLAQTIVREISAVDRNVAPYDVLSFSTLRRLQLFPLRALATIASFLGILALILTAIGIYGVLSYAVTQRTKEIGVRMALGASHNAILQLILRQGMTFVFIGAAAGLLGALFATQFLSSVLFQVSPTDLTSFLTVTALVAIISIVASVIPARRAMKIEPTITLRYE